MSSPQPPKPMAGQPTGVLEIGSQMLAIQHAVEALIKTLPRGDARATFIRSLPKWPDDATDAYKESMRRFLKAAEA